MGVLGETRTPKTYLALTCGLSPSVRGRPTGSYQSAAEGALPATGAVAALITKATGKEPYFVGKPNPLMMRTGLNAIGAHSETSAMIGDRMDTDILAGLEAGMETFLVLTGLTAPGDIDKFPYRPTHVKDSIADLVDYV
ncbi:HAD-superfamily hydrolase [Streptomyces sp. C]|nr:HAD-superfamily hydrolase [Streptomyces sp. C]